MRAVSVTAIGDTTAPLLCLGLLYQQEDTIQGLDQRMRRRFAPAKFSRGSANKSINNLVKEGHIELVAKGDKRTLARYRITPSGSAYFVEWLRQTELPPMVRDVLQCKLEFFEFEDMPGVIEAIEEQAFAFGASADLAHETLQAEQRIRRDRQKRSQPPSWRLALGIAKTKDAVNLGYKMHDRLNEAVEELKEIYKTFSSIEDGGGDE